ncbi:MAG TPA: adenylate/guanylate cyclase domain-containing protein [Anaerolineae bacterium]
MTTTVETIASYVPTLVTRRLSANLTPLTAPIAEHFPAAVLFADISGFTALAERLAERGPSGTEDLSRLLNAYFGQLIDVIAEHDGDVVKFAGDALIALWQATEGDLATAALRAAQCALASQVRMDAVEMTDNVRMTMRVGIAAGEIFTAHVGGVLGRWELLVAGEPLIQVSAAEQLGQPGQVVVMPETWSLIRDQCSGDPLPGGAVRLETVTAPEYRTRPGLTAALPAEAENALRAYIPGAILSRLAAGQTDWIAELRLVSVIFINLPDLSHNAPLELSQEVMQALQTVLYHYEGSINKFNVDDKGVTLVAALGLPPFAHEDDAVRATRAALDMQARLRKLGARSAIAITTGRAFCGSVGQVRRREYTMIGSAVNLAARLMQVASQFVPGEAILCDSATRELAESRLEFKTLAPVIVKGRVEPVEIYRPLGDKQSAVPTHGGIVGRDPERALFAESLRSVQRGDPLRVILIESEPGTGKSRLVEEFLRMAGELQVRGLVGGGDAIDRSTPYFAWRPVFNQLFGIEAVTDPTTRRARVLSLLESDPERRALAPLLNQALSLDLPDNDFTKQLAGQVRVDNTRSLLLDLLLHGISPGGRSPALLVFDDAHWLDSASWALVGQVNREAPSMLLVIATRPIDEPVPAEYRQIIETPHTQRLHLHPLPEADIIRLLCQRLNVTALPEPVVKLILEKAEGHPFFSEELVNALRDRGLIEIRGNECRITPAAGDLSMIDLPDTVDGVIISRIDRLSAPQQLTLKVASVIGRVFAYRILEAIHPIESDKSELATYLNILRKLDLTPLETMEPEVLYSFKHIITRDVVYGLMLFAQRQRLHRAVAEWYEHTQAQELAPFYPLLAHHWRLADVPAKAVEYYEESGEQALVGGAYREAANFYEEALSLDQAQTDALVGQRSNTPAERRAHWHRQLAEAYLGLGKLAESRGHLEQALKLLGRPVSEGRRVARELLGQALIQVGHRLRPTRVLAPDEGEHDVILEAARVHDVLVRLYYFAQERSLLVNSSLHALNLAERVGAMPELARLYALMCVVSGLVRLHGLARMYERLALQASVRVNEPQTTGRVQARIGLYNLGIGNWKHAAEALDESAAIAERLNDHRQWGESAGLRAYVAYHQGEFVESQRRFAEVGKRATTQGNVQYQGWGLWGQAHGLIRLGKLDEAVASLNAVLELLAHTHDRGAEVVSHGLLAVAYVYKEEWQLAQVSADNVIRLVSAGGTRFSLADLEGLAGAAEVYLTVWERQIDYSSGTDESLTESALNGVDATLRYARVYSFGRPRAWLLRSLYYRLAGNTRRAQQDARISLRAARELEMPYEQARTHYEIGRHLDVRDPDRKSHLQTALEIFSRLHAPLDEARVRAALSPEK